MRGACRKAAPQQAVACDWSSDHSSLGGAQAGRVQRGELLLRAACWISLRLALPFLSFFFLQAAAALSHLWLPGGEEQSICGS